MLEIANSILAAELSRYPSHAHYTGVYIFEMPAEVTNAQLQAATALSKNTAGRIQPSNLRGQLENLGGKLLAGSGYHKSNVPWSQPQPTKLVISTSNSSLVDPVTAHQAGTMSLAVLIPSDSSGVSKSYSTMNYTGHVGDAALYATIGEPESGADLEFFNVNVEVGEKIALNDIAINFTNITP